MFRLRTYEASKCSASESVAEYSMTTPETEQYRELNASITTVCTPRYNLNLSVASNVVASLEIVS